MTDLRQAAMQALEALEESLGMVDNLHCYGICMDAITALRTALEQPEQERWQWIFEDKCGDRYTHKNLFYTEAEAAESAKICGVKAIRKTGESKVTAATPVAQPEQEPVAVVDEVIHAAWSAGFVEGEKAAMAQQAEPVAFYNPQHGGFYWAKPTTISAPQAVDIVPLALYTTPPQRQWVGLTDYEIAALDWQHATVDAECVRAIETLLKERNNG
jgi:hypothetical protein